MELTENQIKALNWAGWIVKYIRNDDKDKIASFNDGLVYVEISYYSELHFEEEDVEEYLIDLEKKYNNYVMNNKGKIIQQIFDWDRTKTKTIDQGITIQISPKKTHPIHQYTLCVAQRN
jgi:hypothetical protein